MQFKSQKDHKRRVLRSLYNRNSFFDNITFVSGMSGSGTTLLAAYLYQNFLFAGIVPEGPNIVSKNNLYMPKTDSFETLKDYKKYILAQKIEKNLFKNSLNKINQQFAELFCDQNNLIMKTAIIPLIQIDQYLNSYEKSYMLVIFSNPILNIEGLKRKWRLFSNSSINDLCDFWNVVYQSALDFYPKKRIIFIEYETFLTKTENIILTLQEILNLKRRKKIKKLQDNNHKSVKGLRGVKEGVIKLDKKVNSRQVILDQDSTDEIISKTRKVYKKLKIRFSEDFDL